MGIFSSKEEKSNSNQGYNNVSNTYRYSDSSTAYSPGSSRGSTTNFAGSSSLGPSSGHSTNSFGSPRSSFTASHQVSAHSATSPVARASTISRTSPQRLQPVFQNTSSVSTTSSFVYDDVITAAARVVLHEASNYIIPVTNSSNVGGRKFTLSGRHFFDRFVIRPCPQYLSKKGCCIEFCYRLHVCQFWIKGGCHKEDCPFDHGFQGPDNIALYQALSSRKFDEVALKEKLRRKCGDDRSVVEDEAYICSDFLYHKCKRSDCNFFHLGSPYSWQLCRDGKWLPFPRNQNEELERAFSKPSNSEYTLKDQGKSQNHKKRFQQLDSVLSQATVKIDFENMSLVTSDKKFCRIRRLSTRSDLAVFKSVATRWLWYWQECDGSWVFYTSASIDISNNNNNNFIRIDTMVIIPFSDYIESQFLRKKNIDDFKPLQAGSSYAIDFKSMIQTNKSTLVSRKIRRRPIQREDFQWKDATTIRSLWSVSRDSKETYIREPISSSSPEYAFVQQMVSGTLSITEMHLERIENIHLWEAYQLKKRQILKAYQNDIKAVNEQYLFHGTANAVVDKICSENLDWRLYGTCVGNVYGKGTYFANTARFSNAYSVTDGKGFKWMFVVLVLVGTAAVGNKSMNIPPVDPQTKRRFDSTVNDAINPCIFVKYDLDDYYPVYVFKYK